MKRTGASSKQARERIFEQAHSEADRSSGLSALISACSCAGKRRTPCRTGHRGNGCRTNRPTNKPRRLLRNMELRDRGKSVSRAREATCSGMRIVLRHSAGIRSARIFRDPRAQSSESATVTRILSIRRPSIASTRRVSRRYASVSPRRRKSFLISSISPASVSASPFASSR